MLAFNEAATLTLDLDDIDDEQTEFKFSELSDRAKAHARDQRREWNVELDWWDSTYDDAVDIANMMNISIDTRTVKLYGGGIRQEPDIFFTGFWSQGDGACFSGRWSPADSPIDLLNKVMAHAPQDERLHEIAFAFAELSERHGPEGEENGAVSVRITRSGNYCHEYSVDIDVEFFEPRELNDFQMMTWEALRRGRGMDTFEDDVKEALRDFMRWIYRQLEAEYEWLTSDEAIDEALADITFDEDGNEI